MNDIGFQSLSRMLASGAGIKVLVLDAHFYKAVMEANEYPGPAIINVFATCQPEHGVACKGRASKQRLSVVGN